MASQRPDLLSRLDRVLAPVTWLAAAFTVVVLAVGPELIGAETSGARPASAPTEAASGEEVFTSSCGGCHSLAAAGTTGSTGPDLDDLRPSADTVAAVVASGAGVMPAFEGDLSAEEIQAVADYVAGAAGG